MLIKQDSVGGQRTVIKYNYLWCVSTAAQEMQQRKAKHKANNMEKAALFSHPPPPPNNIFKEVASLSTPGITYDVPPGCLGLGNLSMFDVQVCSECCL